MIGSRRIDMCDPGMLMRESAPSIADEMPWSFNTEPRG
jgi:hypothetical protein